MLLARLVPGGPLHRPPPQIHSELRLRLVAAKLLESRERYESLRLTHSWYNMLMLKQEIQRRVSFQNITELLGMWSTDTKPATVLVRAAALSLITGTFHVYTHTHTRLQHRVTRKAKALLVVIYIMCKLMTCQSFWLDSFKTVGPQTDFQGNSLYPDTQTIMHMHTDESIRW